MNLFKLLHSRWQESRQLRALVEKLEQDNEKLEMGRSILEERLEYYIEENVKLHAKLMMIAELREGAPHGP